MQASTKFARRGSIALALWSSACSLDNRVLQPAEGDDQSFNSLGGQSGTQVGDPGTGGPTPNNGLVDGCADLNTDGVPDCQVTLLQNASFTSDVSSWTPDANTELTWDPKNALDDTPSGSAKLHGTTQRVSALQCVPVTAGQLLVAWANAFVESNDGMGMPPQAELEISFFDNGNCAGASTNYFDTPLNVAVLDAWSVIQAGQTAGATTQSVSVALVGLLNSGSEVNVYFDNVMLAGKSP
jgi:hypothetical protein